MSRKLFADAGPEVLRAYDLLNDLAKAQERALQLAADALCGKAPLPGKRPAKSASEADWVGYLVGEGHKALLAGGWEPHAT